MKKEKLAEEFSIGGAKLIALDVSSSMRKLSGADKEVLESVYTQSLTPMKDYAQSVEKLSGMGKDAAEKIFNNTLTPMQNYGENVPPLFKALVGAIDKGYNVVYDVNKPNDALELSEKAKGTIAKMATLNPAVKNKKLMREVS